MVAKDEQLLQADAEKKKLLLEKDKADEKLLKAEIEKKELLIKYESLQQQLQVQD